MTDTKNVKYYDNLAVASSPHLVTALDTQKTMMWVLIAHSHRSMCGLQRSV